MPSGTLIVKPLYGRLTHDTESFGSMDPFCVVKIGSQNQKTNVANGAGKK